MSPMAQPVRSDFAPGVRTGAWSRRALLRAHGWWHARADTLAAVELGWGQRRGHVAIDGGVVTPRSRAEYDTLVANLLLLGAMSGCAVCM